MRINHVIMHVGYEYYVCYSACSCACVLHNVQIIQDMMNDFYPTKRTIKVNWGNSRLDRHEHAHVWGNKIEAVHRSGYKRLFFELCKDLGTVPVCTSYEGPCFQHSVPNGSNGLGVVYVDREEDFFPQYIPDESDLAQTETQKTKTAPSESEVEETESASVFFAAIKRVFGLS
jgi:hypothetical protein